DSLPAVGQTLLDGLSPAGLQRKVSECVVTLRSPFPSFAWRNHIDRICQSASMLRRVGPEQVALLTFLTSVDQTERHADHEGSGGRGGAAPPPGRLLDPPAPPRPLY